jgi:hypothetical protein
MQKGTYPQRTGLLMFQLRQELAQCLARIDDILHNDHIPVEYIMVQSDRCDHIPRGSGTLVRCQLDETYLSRHAQVPEQVRRKYERTVEDGNEKGIVAGMVSFYLRSYPADGILYLSRR